MDTDPSSNPVEGEITPIAIIGLAFEFPQDATSEEAFWSMLCEGRSASTEFPPDRISIDAFYHPDSDRPSTVSMSTSPGREILVC
jgi:acyl transferase domain-containing protein